MLLLSDMIHSMHIEMMLSNKYETEFKSASSLFDECNQNKRENEMKQRKINICSLQMLFVW